MLTIDGQNHNHTNKWKIYIMLTMNELITSHSDLIAKKKTADNVCASHDHTEINQKR